MAFNNMLDVAYGRVGKLRYELMQSLLSAPDTPLPPPVIPGKDKSRPPVYSHELRALLMSSFARKNPLKARDLFSPPILPARAKPGSADAILLGPLSKRREANIRRRYFTTEWKKVLPPLQISVEPSCSDRNSKPDVASPRDIGFEQTNVLQQVLDLAGGCFLSPRPTRREHKFHIDAVPPCSNPFDGNLPTRWLRRRYRELLGRLPLLTCQPEQSVHQGYAISVSKNALIGGKWQASRLRFVDEDDQAWLQDMRGLQRSAIL
ncbi:hypothetical protein ID866_2944 [Astraeus odoratus]|nr:hypothetical protein ID866_2944 [Astraeus odoratus]